jgi:antitoxin component YwqK of YwqJK toxin-antitoxin module
MLSFNSKGLMILIMFLMACSNTQIIEKKNSQGIVIERYQVIKKNNQEIKDGFYERYDDSGKILEKSQYKEDKLNGPRKLYQNGILESEEHRLNDLYIGDFKSYFPNGNLQLEARYVDNVMSGDVKVYYQNGKLKEIVRFANNVEDGPFIEYYENGKLKAEGNYKPSDGPVEHGELKLYDTSGTLIRIMNCELGKCTTTWSKDTLNHQ